MANSNPPPPKTPTAFAAPVPPMGERTDAGQEQTLARQHESRGVEVNERRLPPDRSTPRLGRRRPTPPRRPSSAASAGARNAPAPRSTPQLGGPPAPPKPDPGLATDAEDLPPVSDRITPCLGGPRSNRAVHAPPSEPEGDPAPSESREDVPPGGVEDTVLIERRRLQLIAQANEKADAELYGAVGATTHQRLQVSADARSRQAWVESVTAQKSVPRFLPSLHGAPYWVPGVLAVGALAFLGFAFWLWSYRAEDASLSELTIGSLPNEADLIVRPDAPERDDSQASKHPLDEAKQAVPNEHTAHVGSKPQGGVRAEDAEPEPRMKPDTSAETTASPASKSSAASRTGEGARPSRETSSPSKPPSTTTHKKAPSDQVIFKDVPF